MVAARTEVDERWRARAACRGMDTELFFPPVGRDTILTRAQRQQIEECLAVCNQCPVIIECWSYAKYFDAREGIWGGVLFNRHGRPQSRLALNA